MTSPLPRPVSRTYLSEMCARLGFNPERVTQVVWRADKVLVTQYALGPTGRRIMDGGRLRVETTEVPIQ